MKAFSYARAASPRDAVGRYRPGAAYLGGGTNLVDLIRLRVAGPDHVIDVTRAVDDEISETQDGGLRIGAGVRNSDLGSDHRVRERYPMLARAVLSGASWQIRNAATVGGNLLQRTRCPYFQDAAMPCNKRSPGSGRQATAPGADAEHMAMPGHSPFCIATHPSDMAVALTALNARVRVLSPENRGLTPEDRGGRWIEMPGLHRLPGGTPHCRAALGGIAHAPWRALAAERVVLGLSPGPDVFSRAAEAELRYARPLAANAYKVTLARSLIVSVLAELSPVASGRIGAVDTTEALAMPGVMAVLGAVTTLPFAATVRVGMEQTAVDAAAGGFVRKDLAQYHIATCADVPEVEAFWITEDDPRLWPGGKGIGEIGITGTAAAIGNAVYHATGRRFRDLPITPAKPLSPA